MKILVDFSKNPPVHVGTFTSPRDFIEVRIGDQKVKVPQGFDNGVLRTVEVEDVGAADEPWKVPNDDNPPVVVNSDGTAVRNFVCTEDKEAKKDTLLLRLSAKTKAIINSIATPEEQVHLLGFQMIYAAKDRKTGSEQRRLTKALNFGQIAAAIIRHHDKIKDAIEAGKEVDLDVGSISGRGKWPERN